KSMSLLSKIEWTAATWNPVRGCTKVSPGCKHCYAERFAERFRGVKGHPFEHGFDLRLGPYKLCEALRWSEPRMIFVNSMSDLFHNEVLESFIFRVAATMRVACWRLTRSVRWRRRPRRPKRSMYCTPKRRCARRRKRCPIRM